MYLFVKYICTEQPPITVPVEIENESTTVRDVTAFVAQFLKVPTHTLNLYGVRDLVTPLALFLPVSDYLSTFSGGSSFFMECRKKENAGISGENEKHALPRDIAESLLTATRHGLVTKVKRILNVPPYKFMKIDFGIRDALGKSLLISAVESREEEMLDLILTLDIDRDIESDQGVTALLTAVLLGEENFVRKIIEAKSDVNYITSTKRTALGEAVTLELDNIISLLLRAQANPNILHASGCSPLALACKRQERLHIALNLIAFSADVNPTNSAVTPLVAACVACRVDFVEVLFEHGADVDGGSQRDQGPSPLHVAANLGRKDILLSLLHCAADPNLPSGTPLTLPIVVAASAGHWNIVKILFVFGSRVDHPRFVDGSIAAVCDLKGLDNLARFIRLHMLPYFIATPRIVAVNDWRNRLVRGLGMRRNFDGDMDRMKTQSFPPLFELNRSGLDDRLWEIAQREHETLKAFIIEMQMELTVSNTPDFIREQERLSTSRSMSRELFNRFSDAARQSQFSNQAHPPPSSTKRQEVRAMVESLSKESPNLGQNKAVLKSFLVSLGEREPFLIEELENIRDREERTLGVLVDNLIKRSQALQEKERRLVDANRRDLEAQQQWAAEMRRRLLAETRAAVVGSAQRAANDRQFEFEKRYSASQTILEITEEQMRKELADGETRRVGRQRDIGLASAQYDLSRISLVALVETVLGRLTAEETRRAAALAKIARQERWNRLVAENRERMNRHRLRRGLYKFTCFLLARKNLQSQTDRAEKMCLRRYLNGFGEVWGRKKRESVLLAPSEALLDSTFIDIINRGWKTLHGAESRKEEVQIGVKHHRVIAARVGEEAFIIQLAGVFSASQKLEGLVNVSVFRISSNSWIYLHVIGSAPPLTRGSGVCLCEGNVYVFGGRDGGRCVTARLWRLDRTGLFARWKEVVVAGSGIGPRYHMAMAYAHPYLMVHGGRDASNAMLSDTWVLNLERSTKQWRQILPLGLPPKARSHHTLTLVGKDRLIIFGGRGGGSSDSQPLGDAALLSFEVDSESGNGAWRWATPPDNSGEVSGRYKHGVGVVGSTLFVVGGCLSKRDPVASKFVLLNTENCCRMPNPMFTSMPTASFSWRKNSSYSQLGQTLWIIGAENTPPVSRINLHMHEEDWLPIGAPPGKIFATCEPAIVSPARRDLKYEDSNLIVHGSLGLGAPVRRIFDQTGLGFRPSNLDLDLDRQTKLESKSTNMEWISRLGSLGEMRQSRIANNADSPPPNEPDLPKPDPRAQFENEDRAAALFFSKSAGDDAARDSSSRFTHWSWSRNLI